MLALSKGTKLDFVKVLRTVSPQWRLDLSDSDTQRVVRLDM
jgi:hypothetical protein